MAADEDAHKKLVSALQRLGQEPHTLEQMESWDAQVYNFDLKTASAREFIESVQQNFQNMQNVSVGDVIWELQRLTAMVAKLKNARQERLQRLEDLDLKFKAELDTMSQQIHVAEAKIDAQEQEVLKFEAACATTGGECEAPGGATRGEVASSFVSPPSLAALSSLESQSRPAACADRPPHEATACEGSVQAPSQRSDDFASSTSLASESHEVPDGPPRAAPSPRKIILPKSSGAFAACGTLPPEREGHAVSQGAHGKVSPTLAYETDVGVRPRTFAAPPAFTPPPVPAPLPGSSSVKKGAEEEDKDDEDSSDEPNPWADMR